MGYYSRVNNVIESLKSQVVCKCSYSDDVEGRRVLGSTLILKDNPH